MSKTKLELSDWAKAANILTSLKFLTVPLMVYFAYLGKIKLFILFLLVSWFIDFIDGTLATLLNQRTKLGYYLDSYTDILFLLGVAASLYFNYRGIFSRYSIAIIALICMVLLNVAIGLLKFRKAYLFHLWSGKAAMNVLALFFLTLLGSPELLFLDLFFLLCILSEIESFFILMRHKQLDYEILTIFDPDGRKMKILKENLKLWPNRITLIRYIALPFLIYFAYKGYLAAFSVFFYVAFISDQLDGIVARRLKQCSDFGSDMDAIADDIYNVLGVAFLYLLRKQILIDFMWLIITLLVFFAIDKIIHALKFKANARLHLYSGKVYQRYYYLVLPIIIYTGEPALMFGLFLIGMAASLERIAIYLTQDSLNRDFKSFIPLKYNIFYHIMKYWP